MVRPLSFRWDVGFVARVDAARGDVSRSLWVRRAVERALGDSGAPSVITRPPAPAERPLEEMLSGRWGGVDRAAVQASRGDRDPVPAPAERPGAFGDALSEEMARTGAAKARDDERVGRPAGWRPERPVLDEGLLGGLSRSEAFRRASRSEAFRRASRR